MGNGTYIEILLKETRALIKSKKKRKLPFKLAFSQFALIFLSISIMIFLFEIFAFPFTMEELQTMRKLKTNKKAETGEIVDAWVAQQETDDNDAVIAYEYVFSNPSIGEFRGVSYSRDIHPVGEKVKVYYNADAPYHSRISNMWVGPAQPSALTFNYVAIALALVLLLVVTFMVWYRKLLLERGELVLGEITSNKEYGEADKEESQQYNVICTFINTEGEQKTLSKIGTTVRDLAGDTPIGYPEGMSEHGKFLELWGKSLQDWLRQHVS